MSDAPTPPLDPTPPGPSAASTARAGKLRKWRRRLSRVLLVLFIVVVLGRFLVSLAFPLVVGHVVAFYNLSCTYDRAELSISDGNLNLFNLTLRPKEGGEPIAHADFIYGNISPLELLRGRLHVFRVEADGTELSLDRNADGTIPLLQRLFPATVTKTSSNPATPPRPIDLQSPLKVEAFRLTHLNVHIRDQHVSPTLDTVVQLAVRVSNLGVPGEPTSFEVSVSADQLLEDLLLKGQAKTDGNHLDALMTVAIRDLHPTPAAGYLLPAGIRPASDSISMRMSAALTATASTNVPGALTGNLALSDLRAEADGQQSIRVDSVNVGIDSFDPTALRLGQVLVAGVHVSTSRTHEGLLRACGVELTTPEQNNASPTTAPAYPISVASVQLHDCRLDLVDEAVTPPANLAVQLDALMITEPPAGGPLAIVGRLGLPGVAKQINLSGSTDPFAPIKTADVKVRVEGIQPTALKPYLDALGLESEFKDGSFGCDLTASLSPQPDGGIAADAHLSKLRLDNGAELLGLNDVVVKGASANARRIRFESIDISGPALMVQRDASGALSLLGMRTKPPTAPATAPSAASTNTATSQPAAARTPLPRLEIGKFNWHDAHVHLVDQAISPPQSIAIDDVGVEAHDLKLGLDPADYADNTGTIKAWLVAPHLIDRLDFDGVVTPGPSAVQLDLTATGSGISPAALGPYLKPFGVEPLTHDGSLKVHALVALAKKGDALDASLQLDGFHYGAAGGDLVAVDGMRIGHVQIGGEELAITSVVIDHPQARIERDADGGLIFAGVKLLEPQSAPPSARVTNGSAALAAGQSPITSTAPFVGTLRSLQIHNAALSWTDRAVHPAVTTSLTSDIDLKNLTIGRPAHDATVRIAAAIPDVARRVTVFGEFSPARGNQSAHLDVAAFGVEIGPLAPYLPPGITSTLSDGRLNFTLDGEIIAHSKGGVGGKLQIHDLDYRDGDSPDALFTMDDLSVIGSRIDPTGGVIALDEVSTRGIELSASRAPGGAIRLMGLSIASPPPTTQPAATQPAGPPAAAPAAGPGLSAAQIVAAANKALPLVTLDKLDLNVHRVSFVDATRPKAAALSLVDLRLQNKNRIVWLGPDAATRPPTQLLLTSGVAPLADQLSVAMKVTPFALHPAVALDLAVTGIHGDGLTKLVPELADTLDGSAMTNGQAEAHVEAVLKLDRRDPMVFDFSTPYAADFLLTNVRFRSSPGSPTLGGLDEVQAEDIRVRPATSNVEVKSLEITKPALLVAREKDGIHALGWTIKLPAPTTQPTTQPTKQPMAVASKAPAPSPTTQPAPTGEIKIDRILASGLDVRIEDRTTSPVTVIPLSALDLEIRDLSSQAPYQDKPVRFSVLINSGKVSLPARTKSGVEDRELFSQISASGKVGLYPQYNGWAKASVSGFDLSGLTAEAAAYNITLTRGAFDANVDLHFEPGNVIDTSAKLIVTDLSLSEQPKGPISSALQLPAPLDVCIGALEDPDGSITLPLNFQIKDARPEGIAGAAVGAVSSVIVTAVASAPVKVVGGVGNLLGLGPKKPGQEQPIVLPYDPGAVALEEGELSTLRNLAQRMIKEPNIELTILHTFGAGDVAVLASRANPSADDARSLAYQLRAHKLELSSLRAQVSGQAEAQLAAFDATDASATIDRLRAIDRELAQTEDALDRTYDLLRPGAQRQADRRTRAAALEVAAQRLLAIRAELRALGVADVDRRVHLLHPTFTPGDQADSSVTVQPVRTKGGS